MASKFEVYQDRVGHYRARLKARNGQVVASVENGPMGSGWFETPADAKRGCEAVQTAADGATIEEVEW